MNLPICSCSFHMHESRPLCTVTFLHQQYPVNLTSENTAGLVVVTEIRIKSQNIHMQTRIILYQ